MRCTCRQHPSACLRLAPDRHNARRVACRAEQKTKKQTDLQQAESLSGRELTQAEADRLASLKSRSAPEQQDNKFLSVLAELKYIEWPKPQDAAMDTAIVIAIVLGSAAFLFALNGLFAEIAKLVY